MVADDLQSVVATQFAPALIAIIAGRACSGFQDKIRIREPTEVGPRRTELRKPVGAVAVPCAIVAELGEAGCGNELCSVGTQSIVCWRNDDQRPVFDAIDLRRTNLTPQVSHASAVVRGIAVAFFVHEHVKRAVEHIALAGQTDAIRDIGNGEVPVARHA